MSEDRSSPRFQVGPHHVFHAAQRRSNIVANGAQDNGAQDNGAQYTRPVLPQFVVEVVTEGAEVAETAEVAEVSRSAIAFTAPGWLTC